MKCKNCEAYDTAFGCGVFKCNYMLSKRLAAYEDTGLEPEEIKLNMDGLDEYHKAEAEGRLVILPVKAGDTVYQLRDKKHALGVGVHPRHISCVWVYGNDWIAVHQGDKPCAKKDFGKTWFLTRAEAEAVLQGGQDDGTA